MWPASRKRAVTPGSGANGDVGDADEARQRVDGVVLVVDRLDRLPVRIVAELAVELVGVRLWMRAESRSM